MKRRILCAMLLLLILSLSLPALAGTCYVKTSNGKTVNLRSAEDNSVLAQIPYGTRLTYDDDLSTELAAFVTYNGYKGYVKWTFLSDTKPAAYKKTSSSSSKSSQIIETYGTGAFSVTAENAYLQFPGKNGKGSGSKYASVSFDDPADLVVTASIPKGKKLSGWIINGIRMTFYSTVKTFRLPEITESLTIEAVYK